MDSRLFHIPLRPGHLRDRDLSLVARAIVALYRRQARTKTGVTENLGYVRIEAKDFTVQLLADDWKKILPYIEDGTLDPLMYPTTSSVDPTNQQHYLRVLHLLQVLFPEKYPTSNE